MSEDVLRVEQFPRSFRFRLVKAYPMISEVPDVYEATPAEIDAGFARVLVSRHIGPICRYERDRSGWAA